MATKVPSEVLLEIAVSFGCVPRYKCLQRPFHDHKFYVFRCTVFKKTTQGSSLIIDRAIEGAAITMLQYLATKGLDIPFHHIKFPEDDHILLRLRALHEQGLRDDQALLSLPRGPLRVLQKFCKEYDLPDPLHNFVGYRSDQTNYTVRVKLGTIERMATSRSFGGARQIAARLLHKHLLDSLFYNVPDDQVVDKSVLYDRRTKLLELIDTKETNLDPSIADILNLCSQTDEKLRSEIIEFLKSALQLPPRVVVTVVAHKLGYKIEFEDLVFVHRYKRVLSVVEMTSMITSNFFSFTGVTSTEACIEALRYIKGALNFQ